MKSVSFPGGLKLPATPEATLPPIEVCPVPETLVLPLVQHHGPPCVPVVSKGDTVRKGDIVAESAHTVINAPVSGQIQDTKKACLQPDGSWSAAIEIANDGQETLSSAPDPHLKAMGRIYRAGLNDLSPPALPLLRKLALAQEKRIHTLIVNGLDEAFVHGGQSALMAAAPAEIMQGVQTLQELFRAERVLVAVYAEAEEAVQALQAHTTSERIQIVPCRAKHPQHKNQLLVSALLDLEYPPESTPEDFGVSVVTVETLHAVTQCVEHGQPFINKLITVGGAGVTTPKVASVRLGTSLQEVFAFLGIDASTLGKVILGGPLTGQALFSLDLPVTKDMHVLCVQNREDIARPRGEVCFKCGYCVEACPMRLMPFLISGFSEGGHPELAEKHDIYSCIECGCCAFVCPAGIPMVQWIQLGKSALNAA